MQAAPLYGPAHFLHVAGALGMAAAFSLEGAGLVGLRRATDADEARLWLRTRRWVLLLGPPSILVLLVTGIYLTVAVWGPADWIVVSLASLVVIALVGGVLTGIPTARVTPAVERAVGSMPKEIQGAVRNPILTISIATRTAMTVGIVFLMVLKPALLASVLTVVGLTAAVGVAVGLVLGRRTPVSPISPAAGPTTTKR